MLRGSELVGTLTYPDLFKLPFILCLFSLTLEVEQGALAVLGQDSKAAWDALSNGRKEKTIENYRRRFGQEPDRAQAPTRELLECTYFSDKGRLLHKLRLLPEEWTKKIEGFFARAETIRNTCAHPGSEGDTVARMPDRGQLGEFVREAEAFLQDLRFLTAG